MLDSRNHLYQVIMEFLLTKPVPNLDTVPEFYKLFESGNLTHVKERTFVLEILRDGVRHYNDYVICGRTHIWEMVMSLYNSPLSTPAHNLLITEILLSASKVPFVGRALVKSNGLFTWLAYHLSASTDVQMTGTLLMCAKNCVTDMLRSKRRAVYDAHTLISPLLKTTKLGLSVEAVQAVLEFVDGLLLFYPSGEPLKSLIIPENLALLVETGTSFVGSSRMSVDDAAWRRRCQSTIKVSKLLFSVNSNKNEMCIWNLSSFLSVVLSDQNLISIPD